MVRESTLQSPRRLRRWAGMGAAATLAAAMFMPFGSPAADAAAPDTISRTSPGSTTWVVPAGVHTVAVRAVGGEGGRGGTDMGGAWGGAGQAVSGTIAVTPGETLRLDVGSRGGDGASGSGSDSGGAPGTGWTGGGRGGNGSRLALGSIGWGGGGGGGSTAVIMRGDVAVVAAGGGGGGGRSFCDGNPGGDGGESGRKVNNSCDTNGGDPGLVGAAGNAHGLPGSNGADGQGQGGGGGGGAGIRGGGGADASMHGGGGGGGGRSVCSVDDCSFGVGARGHGSIQLIPVHTPLVTFDEAAYDGHTGTAVDFSGRVSTQHASGGIPEGTVTLEAVNADGETATMGVEPVDQHGRFTFSCTVACDVDIADVTTVRAAFSSSEPSYWAAADGTAELTFVSAETQTALFIDPSDAVTGQVRDFTATVSVLQPASGAVHGDVEFRMSNIDGTEETVLGTAPLAANYQATFSAGVFEATGKRFCAEYLGTTGFNGSTSPKQTLRTDQAATAIAAQTSPNPTVTGEDFELDVSVDVLTPGDGTPSGAIQIITDSGEIEVTLDDDGAASIPLDGRNPGELEISVAYPGDDDYAASVTSLTHTVHRAEVDLGLSIDAAESVYGESFVLTGTAAAVLPGRGTVTGAVEFGLVDDHGEFETLGDAVTLEDGTAELVVTGLDVGSYEFEARYAETDRFSAAISPRATHEIAAAAATVTVAADPEVNVYSLTQEVVIQVSGAGSDGALPADGYVQLVRLPEASDEESDDTHDRQASGVAPMADGAAEPPFGEVLADAIALDEHGQAIVALDWLDPDVYEVYAIYSGSLNFDASASEPASFVIEQAVPAVSLSGAAEATVDEEQSFTVEVGAFESADAESSLAFAPTGTVEVRVDGEPVAADVELREQEDGSFTAVATVEHDFSAPGSYTVSARYGGDRFVVAGESAPLSVQVLEAAADDVEGPGSSDGLPRTGAEVSGGMLAAAVLLLLTGTAATVLRRRRFTQ